MVVTWFDFVKQDAKDWVSIDDDDDWRRAKSHEFSIDIVRYNCLLFFFNFPYTANQYQSFVVARWIGGAAKEAKQSAHKCHRKQIENTIRIIYHHSIALWCYIHTQKYNTIRYMFVYGIRFRCHLHRRHLLSNGIFVLVVRENSTCCKRENAYS